MSVTTWNTAPDYDAWGVDEAWSCDDWITWHKKLKEHFGQKEANYIWNYAYAKSGQFSSNLNCRTFNSVFREYVRVNDLDPYANAGIFNPVLKTYGAAEDVLSGSLKGISGFFSANNVKTILNIALIAGVLIGGAYVYKSFKK